MGFNDTNQTNENVLSIDCTNYSEGWQETLGEAVPYMPCDNQFPSLVIPVPDRSDSLILSQNKPFYSPIQTFATLRKYGLVLQIFDYTLWIRALRHFNCFGTKMLPMVSRTSCIFPVATSIQHALWVNPLEIEEITDMGDTTLLSMIDGTVVRTFVRRRTFIAHAENTLLALATIRRDFLHPDIPGDRPLDYLNLPNTSFLRVISQRAKLQQFPIPLYSLKQQYEQEQLTRAVIALSKRVFLKELSNRPPSDFLDNND